MSATSSNISLFRRSNGTYYIIYYTEGKRRWKSTGTSVKSEALKVLTNFNSMFDNRPQPITLANFEQKLLAYAQTAHARSTVVIYRIALRHLRIITGECFLSQITPMHVDQYKAKRIEDKVSPVTVNVELRALRTILNVAVRWRFLDKNPFCGMRQIRVPEKRPVFLSRHDLQLLLDLIKEEWLRQLILIAVLTGMRRGELINLRWENVDLSNKVIHVETTGLFRTKAGKRRAIPMSHAVYALLSQRAARPSPSGYVFARNGRPFKGGHVSHRFKHYARRISDDLHWHSLRHTFASWLVQDGASLYEVQKLLGHSSSEMTEIYSHLLPSELHGTVNRIRISLQEALSRSESRRQAPGTNVDKTPPSEIVGSSNPNATEAE